MCNDELTVKLIGKLTLECPDINQLTVRNIIDEVLYNYEISTKEQSLITSDIPDKILYYLACRKIDGLSKKTLYNYKLQLSRFSTYITKPINSISSVDIRMYLSYLQNQYKLK